MNYLTLRYLILCIIYIILIFIILRVQLYNKILLRIKNKTLVTLIIVGIFYIIYMIIWFVPYEGTIVKFSKADDVISHFIKKDKVIKKYEYDDYVYVLYKNNAGVPEFKYFLKDKDNGWRLGNILYEGKGKTIMYEDNFVSIIEIPSRNSIGVEIYCPHIKKDEKYQISDSLGSKFYTITHYDSESKNINKNYREKYGKIYVSIINKTIDDDYTLYMDGREYKPFK